MAKKNSLPPEEPKPPVVRIDSETHRKLKVFAANVGGNMKDIATEAIEDRLRRAKPAGAKS